MARRRSGSAAGILGGLAAVGLAGYGAWVGLAWMRYGREAQSAHVASDALLDDFMPTFDVCERHHVRVQAPADTVFGAACELDLLHHPLVRAIVRAREVLLGAEPDRRPRPRGLLAETRALGWGVLAERPGREIVMGAVTRPWEPRVTFRALPPDAFAAFDEPGYVKIVWTLRADEEGPSTSVFRTETRALATDAEARARFRRYWALLSPGIVLIRLLSLGPVRARAERLTSASR